MTAAGGPTTANERFSQSLAGPALACLVGMSPGSAPTSAGRPGRARWHDAPTGTMLLPAHPTLPALVAKVVGTIPGMSAGT